MARKPDYAGGRQQPLFVPQTDWKPPSELPSLTGVRQLSFDVETKDTDLEDLGPGVRRPGNYIVGVAVGLDVLEGGPKYYLPVRHEGGGNLDEGIVKRWARRQLSAFSGSIVGAALLYDLDWIGAPEWGVDFKHVTAFHDVQVAEPLIDEWRYSYSLEDISRDYLGVGKDEAVLRNIGRAYGYNDGKSIKKNLWRFNAAYAGAYAEGDVDRPAKILPLQMKKLEAESLMEIYNLERRLIPILLGMRQRGVRVDLNRAGEVREALVQRRDESLRQLRHFAGPKAEFLSPDSFITALDDRIASGLIKPYPLTAKKKAPSIKRPWLEANQNDPMIKSIIEGRKVNTIIGTFIDGHMSKYSVGGRIHGEFNQLKNEDGRGTIARFSSSNPNLQNIPARDEELGPLVRSLFLPEDGAQWQRDDYSQVEYRILVNFAIGKGAEEAREKYRNDPKTDYHKLTANMLGVDPEDKVKRKRVKNTNFAKGYGAQAQKLSETFGCSFEEAKAFFDEYEAALPFTVDTFDAASRWGGKRGYVTTILGRRQRFPLWEPIGAKGKGEDRLPAFPHEKALEAYGARIKRAGTYKALNRKIQGSAADIMKKAMVDAYEAGVFAPTALNFPLVTVHDELGTSIAPTNLAREAGTELVQIMQNTVHLMGPRGEGPRIPLLVETERGATWGACK